MRRNIIINFIRDKAVITSGFIINSILLIVFYSLSTGSRVEVLYPLIITLFIFLVVILIEWFRYYRFNLNLHRSIDNMSFDLQPATCEQEEIAGIINGIHDKYIREISEINSANQENRHFLSQWIHGMKTPVSVIDLIIQRSESDGLINKAVLSDIDEENRKLHAILEQVLNIIRLEEFSKDYVPEATDLAASVKKVINSRKSQFIYNKVFPRFECSGEGVYVLSDSKWNELMIDQIVSNAIKYSAAKAESKNIFFNIEKKGKMTLLTIRDEGIGIPRYDMGKIFEPFFTGENGRTFKNATGIGLYICSVAAGKLGHKIEIESEVGKGTCVTITYLSKL